MLYMFRIPASRLPFPAPRTALAVMTNSPSDNMAGMSSEVSVPGPLILPLRRGNLLVSMPPRQPPPWKALRMRRGPTTYIVRGTCQSAFDPSSRQRHRVILPFQAGQKPLLPSQEPLKPRKGRSISTECFRQPTLPQFLPQLQVSH